MIVYGIHWFDFCFVPYYFSVHPLFCSVRDRSVDRAVVPAVVALALAPDPAAEQVAPIGLAGGVADGRPKGLSSSRHNDRAVF